MSEAPPTLDGWFVSHDRWTIDWRKWMFLSEKQRAAMTDELSQALQTVSSIGPGQGDSAMFAQIGQQGDLCFLHFRNSLESIKDANLALRCLAISEVLIPAGSYTSVIEVGLYEATALAQRRLAERDIAPESDEWTEAFEKEMSVQRSRLETRLRPMIPSSKWLCFYPMNKRRTEAHNWYDLDLDARRNLMRGHGRVGHRYHGQVTQIIGGSIGLDDWEWGVSLFADDPLVFKHLVTDMRYDPASSRYADFGPFLVGRRLGAADLARYLAGSLSE